LFVLALFGSALAALGQPEVFQLDPSRTEVAFSLGATMHTVHGSFALKSGEIRFDRATGAISGQIVVDATTGKTGNDRRDRDMHRSVLESQKYPQIVFKPDHFEGQLPPDGSSQIQVHGAFSIHGADHEMTIPVQVEASPQHLSARLRFAVPYVKWGLKDPSTFFLRVKDTVEMEVRSVGRLAAAQP
jgi:polyisoprenoid-binding protein YceI